MPDHVRPPSIVDWRLHQQARRLAARPTSTGAPSRTGPLRLSIVRLYADDGARRDREADRRAVSPPAFERLGRAAAFDSHDLKPASAVGVRQRATAAANRSVAAAMSSRAPVARQRARHAHPRALVGDRGAHREARAERRVAFQAIERAAVGEVGRDRRRRFLPRRAAAPRLRSRQSARRRPSSLPPRGASAGARD